MQYHCMHVCPYFILVEFDGGGHPGARSDMDEESKVSLVRFSIPAGPLWGLVQH